MRKRFECWEIYGPESKQAVMRVTELDVALAWLMDAQLTREVVIQVMHDDEPLEWAFTLRSGRPPENAGDAPPP